MLVIKAYDVMGLLTVEITEVSSSDSGGLSGRFMGRVHTGLKTQDELYFTLDQVAEVLMDFRVDLEPAVGDLRSS